jgi:hypothetical protein
MPSRQGRYCSVDCAMAACGRARKTDPQDRFWPKVEKTDGCWIWRGWIEPGGHGTFYLRGRMRIASRVAWEFANGPVPKGMYVLHKCPGGDNPACVRTDHLYLGTISDNSRDMVERGNVCIGQRHWAKRMPELIQRGEERYSHRLTDAAVRTIRAQHAAGVTSKVLAQQFNVAPRTIRDVTNRLTWTHIK